MHNGFVQEDSQGSTQQEQQQHSQEQQPQGAEAGEQGFNNQAQYADAPQTSTEMDDVGELSDEVTVDALRCVVLPQAVSLGYLFMLPTSWSHVLSYPKSH